MKSMPSYQVALQKLPYLGSRLALLLGHLGGSRMTAVVNDAVMKLDLRELIQRKMFLGEYEPSQTQWFKDCIHPGDTIIDVGASFGYYTTLGSMLVGEAGKVFAFEPSPVPSQIIEDAIADSAIDNIVLTKAAVGKEAGETQLYLPNTPHLHSPSILQSDAAFEAIRIPVLRLDAFKPLQGLDRIALIKIDVEGYEPDVIAGMGDLLGDGRVENIICELNSGWLRRNACTPEQLDARIESLGFRAHRKTPLLTDLRGHHGERFDLQDVWYRKSSLT